jgi:hypothetical protein
MVEPVIKLGDTKCRTAAPPAEQPSVTTAEPASNNKQTVYPNGI